MPETIICSLNGTYHTNVSVAELKELLAQPESVVWLDIHDPDEQDYATLSQLFHVHPLSIEDIKSGRGRPKVEVFEQHYFILFYALCPGETAQSFGIQPLYLFAGANYLISIHHGQFQQVGETIQRWRDPNVPPGNHAGSLLYTLLDTIVDDYFPLIDKITEQVEQIEDDIFEHFEQSSIQSIFNLKRELLVMRRVVAPERDVLNILMRRELPVFRNKDMTYLQDVYDHTIRITDNIDNYRDLLSSALDSYLSVQASRQNEILKVLTVASIVLMTDALIAGIYGMNFQNMPELSWQYGYPLALGLMVALSIGLILFFKRLKGI